MWASIRRQAGKEISIHALLTEGDTGCSMCGFGIHLISIHALLTEGDPFGAGRRRHKPISIHALLTEGDWSTYTGVCSIIHFNPRPPHGG